MAKLLSGGHSAVMSGSGLWNVSPGEANAILGGMGIWLNDGQAVWGASKSFWISSQSACVLQLQQFGSLGFCPVFRWPMSWVLAKEPSVPRAGRRDPGWVRASPVARAQKSGASRCSHFSFSFSSYYFITLKLRAIY